MEISTFEEARKTVEKIKYYKRLLDSVDNMRMSEFRKKEGDSYEINMRPGSHFGTVAVKLHTEDNDVAEAVLDLMKEYFSTRKEKLERYLEGL